jgi:DNA-binding winged helix-turn-helix (wHTH) protein/lipopolysaccharide biosynthesis regulator YciM
MHPKKIRFVPFEVNFEQRELRRSGTRVPLQHKPFRILELLLRQPGTLVSRQELAKELWPNLHVDFEHSLNSAVNSLRQALDDSPRECRYIETRSGLGYRFIAPIEEIAVPGRLVSSDTKTDVHNDYLRGRFFLNKMTSDGIQRAIGCFQSALSEDPNCALAHSGLADCYCQLALNGTVSASDVCLSARESAAAALRMQPDLPEAHISLGRVHMIFDWDWSKASDDWSRASDLNPSLAEAHRARALLASARHRHDDALREIGHAQDLDPLSVPVGFERAWLLYLSRHFDEAVTQCWRVLTLEPSCAPTQTILGLAYHELGSFEEAITELENACVCSDRHPAAVASLGHVYGAAGFADKAQCAFDELVTQSQRRHVSAYWFAVVYTGLDQRHLALDALKAAQARREPPLLWVDVDPRLVTLHSEPDFVRLRRDLRFA